MKNEIRDASGKATASLVTGVISLIISWILPLIGVILSVTGLTAGIWGVKSARQSSAIAGIVLCSIGLIVSLYVYNYNESQTQTKTQFTLPPKTNKELYEGCEREASSGAQQLLKSKIKTETNEYIIERYKSMDENNMFLRDDYDYYLENCLRKNGLK